MAQNHYVDSGDQREAASGVEDHSDLSVFYASKKVEDLGPWMQEADRQKILQAERDKISLGLRKSIVLIGLNVSLPIILGILLIQLIISNTTPDKVNTLIFIVILLGLGLVILTIVLLKWVVDRYQKYSIRALPITLTTLLSLFLVLQKIFDLFQELVGGLIGYGLALAALVITSILISAISIFVWTSAKIHPIAKLIVLMAFVGVAAAIYYLA